jgi:hypothetical protein
MRKVNRQDFLKEMKNKQFPVTDVNGERIYLQDVIMSDYTNIKISSFNKETAHAVMFINGNTMDCRKQNLEVVELID